MIVFALKGFLQTWGSFQVCKKKKTYYGNLNIIDIIHVISLGLQGVKESICHESKFDTLQNPVP